MWSSTIIHFKSKQLLYSSALHRLVSSRTLKYFFSPTHEFVLDFPPRNKPISEYFSQYRLLRVEGPLIPFSTLKLIPVILVLLLPKVTDRQTDEPTRRMIRVAIRTVVFWRLEKSVSVSHSLSCSFESLMLRFHCVNPCVSAIRPSVKVRTFRKRF